MNPKLDVALVLGKRDSPTDALDDYSRLLAAALQDRGHSVKIARCEWDVKGWRRSLRSLRDTLAAGRPRWVLIQYTHLMWSRHGFPQMALAIAWVARRAGSKVGIVIHDPVAYPGVRMRDRVRRRTQYAVMRTLVRMADATVVPIPLANLSWIGSREKSRVHSIPVGSNVGESTEGRRDARSEIFTIAVFGLTEKDAGLVRELAEIVGRAASQIGSIKLVLLGRGSSEAKPLAEQLLSGKSVQVCVVGIVPAGEVGTWLLSADASLFIRGGISARRGTAVAAIAYGLPVVAYEGEETGWPLTEAGVVLAPAGDTQAVTQALIRIAQDLDWADGLRARSRAAYAEHFTWDRIAKRFEELVLN